jgi:hypothetical protein
MNQKKVPQLCRWALTRHAPSRLIVEDKIKDSFLEVMRQ